MHSSTEIETIDINFELGEILMALAIIKPSADLLAYINKFNLESNDIFQYNWICQYLLPLFYDTSFDLSTIKPFIAKLDLKVTQYINLSIDNLSETNYLAVAYEAITALYIMGYRNDSELEYLFRSLMDRRSIYGLFSFLNRTSRFDITGHVLNSIYHLLRKDHAMEQILFGGKYNDNNKII